MAYFVLKKTDKNLFIFNLVADNFEVILTSHGFPSKAGGQIAIASVKSNALLDQRYDRRSNGARHYFVLRGPDNHVLATGGEYPSRQSMEDGIRAVKRIAPNAIAYDWT